MSVTARAAFVNHEMHGAARGHNQEIREIRGIRGVFCLCSSAETPRIPRISRIQLDQLSRYHFGVWAYQQQIVLKKHEIGSKYYEIWEMSASEHP
jgi:hypothetical protein